MLIAAFRDVTLMKLGIRETVLTKTKAQAASEKIPADIKPGLRSVLHGTQS